MANQEQVKAINEQLDREAAAFLRYLLQAAVIKGASWARVRESYRQEAIEEVGHAQFLADQIIMLGGTPALNPDLTPPPSDVRAMLEQDSTQEATDVQSYTRLA